MTKSKFISLLGDGLYLSKVTKFTDDLEGILPYLSKDSDDTFLNIKQIRQALEWVYVSCWYNDETESVEMWEEYGNHGEAIAVQISAFNLQRLFLRENRQVQSYFDDVAYKNSEIETFEKHIPITVLINHIANEGYPQILYSSLFSFYKHVDFSKEKEIRLAVIDSNANRNANNLRDGIFLKISEPMKFFDKIIVSFAWKTVQATVSFFTQTYEKGIKLFIKEKSKREERLQRSDVLPKYDIVIMSKMVN